MFFMLLMGSTASGLSEDWTSLMVEFRVDTSRYWDGAGDQKLADVISNTENYGLTKM